MLSAWTGYPPVYAGQPVAGRPGGAGGLRRQIPVRLFSPLLVLYAAAGLLFPCPLPFLVNLSGLLVCHHPLRHRPLCGQGSGGQPAKKYKKKSPASTRLSGAARVFFAFFCASLSFARGCGEHGAGCLRHDLLEVRRGILLGLLPVMVATTVAGSSLSDPPPRCSSSPRCWWVLLSVGSFVLWRVVSRKNAGSVRKPDPER